MFFEGSVIMVQPYFSLCFEMEEVFTPDAEFVMAADLQANPCVNFSMGNLHFPLVRRLLGG